MVFERSFQCFSHKSFVNFSRKGGWGGGGVGGGGHGPSGPSPKSAHELFIKSSSTLSACLVG